MIDLENDDKRTALLEAAFNKKADVVKYLLDKEAAITTDKNSCNCLDLAITNGDKDSAMVMIYHNRWKEV